MNVASINYHFGSKQKLLEAAIVGSVSHIIGDLDAMLALFADDPHAALTQVLRYILEGTLRYPRLSRAHLYDAFTADDYTGPFFRQFPAFLERLSAALNEAVPSLSGTAASQRVAAAVSAVLFAALFPPFFASETADSPESRGMLVESLVRAALASV